MTLDTRASVRLALVAAALFVLVALGTEGATAGPTTFTVDNAGDENNGCDTNGCTLREAIEAANATPGPNTITFDPSISLITPNPSLPPVDGSQGITIDGTGADPVIQKFPMVDAFFGLVIQSPSGTDIEDVTLRHIGVAEYLVFDIFICAGYVPEAQILTCDADLMNVLLEDVLARDSNGPGIWVSGADVTDAVLRRVDAQDNASDGAFIGASGNLTRGSVQDSQFTGNGGGGAQMASGNTIIEGSVLNSTFASSSNSNVISADSDAVDGFEIGGNTITTTGGGIGIEEAVSDIFVHDNTIDPGEQGIVISGPGGSNFRILDNDITGGSDPGIVMTLASPATGIEIGENTLVDTGGAEHAGIRLEAENAPTAAYMVRNNEVTGSGRDGIELVGAVRAKITRNSLYANGQLGIDLVAPGDTPPGVTFNDLGDGDSGPNALLNFPQWDGFIGYTEGTGDACPNCLIEVFLADNEATGYGEGQTFLLETTADGAGEFVVPLCGLGLAAGTKLTSTATDSQGSTSEFSFNYTLLQASQPCPSASPSPTPSPTATPTPAPTTSVTPTPSITPPVSVEDYTYTNETGQTVSDLHVRFCCFGALASLVTNALDCPAPTVTSAPPGTSAGVVTLDWGTSCVDDGESVTIRITSEPPSSPQCFNWTIADVPIERDCALTQGNVDCSALVDAIDALKILRADAELIIQQQPGCLTIAQQVPGLSPGRIWGDVDCDGAVSPVDALKLLRHDAGLSVQQEQSCPQIGDQLI